jgi:acetyl esterase/lipase
MRIRVLLGLVMLVGCNGATGDNPDGQPGSGGAGGTAGSSPGAGGSAASGRGGSLSSSGGAAAAGTAGALSGSAGSGGSSGGEAGAGAGGGGAGVGGAGGGAGTTQVSGVGGSGRGGAGGSAPGGRGGGTAGTAGIAGTSGIAGSTGDGGAGGTRALPPPMRDTASKVPVSSAPGYTVEGNYIYGPSPSQRLDIIYPSGAGPKGTQILPMVLMFHGGAWIHSYNNNSGKDHMSTFFNRFLAHGFMVCNAEYRVNDGTSPDSAVAPAAVEDALAAAKWCWDYMDYFHGDRTKYVVTGASAGGHLALMVGMTTAAAMLGPTSPADFTIAAIVDGYGPADIVAEINAVAAGWIPNNLANRMARTSRRSSSCRARTITRRPWPTACTWSAC